MNQESLSKILDGLGSNEAEAAIEYRKLHQRLSRFFEWNGVEDPTLLADEAIDRLGKRSAMQGSDEKVRDPAAFALGIARLLLLEEGRRQKKKAEAAHEWEALTRRPASEDETMDEALEHCMGKMPLERRKLLERYYVYSDGMKSAEHQNLARELGIAINALRNRALRARQELETCMRNFLKENIR